MSNSDPWLPAHIGAGIIPYHFENGVNSSQTNRVFFGVRKDTVSREGMLSLPAGYSDVHEASPDKDEWKPSSMNPNCLFLDPVDVALREAREEAHLHISPDNLEPAIWNKTEYVVTRHEAYHATLFPCRLTSMSVQIVTSADTHEMHSWTGYTEKEVYLLAAQGRFAYPHEFEAVKLLFERFRRERNMNL